jgi:hypothetical protein
VAKVKQVFEKFVLFLNRANKPFGAIPLFKGGLRSTIVDCKLIFTTALKSNLVIKGG